MTHMVRVKHVRGFVDDRGGEEAFEGLTITQVVAQKIKPWVKKYGKEGGQSIASLVLKKPESKRGTLIMHCMGQNFLDLVYALEDRLGSEAYVYVDVFSCNVLENLEKQAIKWTEQSQESIQRCGKVILICDLSLAHLDQYEANPLTRLWCLYEMYMIALLENIEFEVYFTENFHDTIVGDLPHWSEMLRTMPIKIERAKSSYPRNKDVLLEAIEKRTSIEDFEVIVDCVIKEAFYVALRGEKTCWQKFFPCCSGGLPDEKEWVEYLKNARQERDTRLKGSKPVAQLNQEMREAASKGTIESVELLLAKKARVDAADNGANLTALHKAAFKGNFNMVNFLIDAKAQVNAQDTSGATALHNACYKGHLEVVETLIRQNGDINMQDNYKRTPLDKAVTNEHEEVVRFIKEQGGKAVRLGSGPADTSEIGVV